MIDFSDQPATATLPKSQTVEKTVEVTNRVVVAHTTVTATPVRNASRTDLMAGQEWTWEQLRDYVIHQIEHFHGPQVRDAVKEKSIFASFVKRWGSDAALIAKSAFEVHDGMWRSAPISINRFCKASDEYFAAPLLQRLR